MRRFLTLAAFALASAMASLVPTAPLAAQRPAKPIPRPKLRDVTDTNDAQAYFDAGLALFRDDPGGAANAFYWATRLNPGWADPLYARRAALLAQKRTLLEAMMTGRDRNRKPELRVLDSMQAHALMLNPFLYRRLDRQLFITWITGGDRQVQADYAYEINVALATAPADVQGWYAYSTGNFERALQKYGDAIGHAKETSGLHFERARIFGMRNEVEPAVEEFQLALGELRRKDEKSLVILYDSKAMAEYSIATLLEGANQPQKARDAYGRALQEDLSYYPAHMRLGLLAISQGDTATGLSELALAAEIAADDPYVRYIDGWVLAKAHRPAEAIVELKKATELEPYYALPNLVLGAQYEAMEKAPEAIAAYTRFVETSSSKDPQRAFAMGRIEDLKAFVSAPNTQ
jgi:Tfp pilus assembly protein PilF